MSNDLPKLYAAFRSGCLGNNILEAYYPFFANIILEQNMIEIDESKILEKFIDKYNIPVPLSFVRQVLGVGIDNGSIIVDHGKYISQKDNLINFKFDSQDFDKGWIQLIKAFKEFCIIRELDISEYDIETRVFDYIDNYDENIVVNGEVDSPNESDTFDYAWFLFLKDICTNSPHIFDFVVALCSSNIMRQTIFYTGGGNDSFSGLNVYLDSPMVFALLNMDSPARTESCQLLVKEMQNAGCIVQILSHNFQEVESILARAALWAISVDYDIQKANNVARYFHDNQFNSQSVAEFCESVEGKLNAIGITVKNVEYDVYKDQFQEDEEILFKMIEERYLENGHLISEERKRSILIDVRSIIMVYRERRGQTATKLQASRDILLTLNSTIANVSKKYESNKSINAGHIPACVSADLFGTVLWLFTPTILMEFRRKQLLADCFSSLQPSKKMLKRYVESLVQARASGEIDEKRFLFMLTHSVVNDALMNVTKGDYARFNERTYLEVYEDIVACADKRYQDEYEAHQQTKDELTATRLKVNELIDSQEIERHSNDLKFQDIMNTVHGLEDIILKKDQEDFNRKSLIWGWGLTLVVFGIPYVIVSIAIEILKSQFTNIYTNTKSIAIISFLTLSLICLPIMFKWGKKWCFNFVERFLKKKLHQIEMTASKNITD